MFGVPASECICTSPNWRDCDDDCDACWGEECYAAMAAQQGTATSAEQTGT